MYTNEELMDFTDKPEGIEIFLISDWVKHNLKPCKKYNKRFSNKTLLKILEDELNIKINEDNVHKALINSGYHSSNDLTWNPVVVYNISNKSPGLQKYITAQITPKRRKKDAVISSQI